MKISSKHLYSQTIRAIFFFWGGGDNRAVTELSFVHITTKTWTYCGVFGFFRRKKNCQEIFSPRLNPFFENTMSCVKCHMSCVMYHVSCFFSLSFGRSGDANRWRVWYQQGLPCLFVKALGITIFSLLLTFIRQEKQKKERRNKNQGVQTMVWKTIWTYLAKL